MASIHAQGRTTIRRRPLDGEPGPAGPAGEDAITATLSYPAIVYNADTDHDRDFFVYLDVKEGSRAVAPDYCRIYRQSGAEIDLSHGIMTIGGVEMSAYREGNRYCIELYLTEDATLDETLWVHTRRGTNLFELPLAIKRVQDGEKGDDGDNGAIVRVTEWGVGKEYRNDPAGGTADADGNRYIDVTCRTGSDGEVLGYWECRSNHVSSEATMPTPTMTSGDQAYGWWLEMNAMKPILTPLIMADNAVLRFVQGNSIKVFDPDNKLMAGIQASSKSQPTLYANPQKYPVAVSLAWQTSSASSPSALGWGTTADYVAANRYLHLLFTITFNDGTSMTSTRSIRFAAATALERPALQFYPHRLNTGVPNSDITAEIITDNPLCTSWGQPYLWARADFGAWRSDWFCIAQHERGASPDSSAWRQLASGDATYGNPEGPRLSIAAAPASGLPRMEVYGLDGQPSAIYDGSVYYSAERIFGTSAAPQTFAFPAEETRQAVWTSSGYGSAINKIDTSFSATHDGILRIPAGVLKVWGRTGAPPSSGLVKQQTLEAQILLDGQPLQTAYITAAGASTLGESAAETARFAAMSIPIAAGSHKLTLQATCWGYPACIAYAKLEQRWCEVSYSRQACRYFANGFAIGSSTDNYCMAHFDGSAMQWAIVNPGAGLKVTDQGVFAKVSGQWKRVLTE